MKWNHGQPFPRDFSSIAVSIIVSFSLNNVAFAQDSASSDPLAELTAQFESAQQQVLDKSETDRFRIEVGYVNALKEREAALQQEGKLEELLEVRRERETFEKTRSLGNSKDNELKKLRGILSEALKPIEAEKSEALDQLTETYLAALENLKVELTKAGDLESAMAAQKRIASIEKSERKPVMTAASTNVSGPESRLTPVPAIKPPLSSGDLFKKPDKWPNQATLPQGEYTINRVVRLPHEKGGELLLLPGTEIKGIGSNPVWVNGGSTNVGEKISFRNFAYQGDLGTRFYFRNCTFEDVTVGKGGGWFGGRFMSRWQFRDCQFSGEFLTEWQSRLTGIQAWRCEFKDIEFPPVEFHKDDRPAEFANHEWALFLRCHFEKCKIPISVLSLMEECSFDDCRFLDDPKPLKFESPIERVLYAQSCDWSVQHRPNNLTFTERPLSEKP